MSSSLDLSVKRGAPPSSALPQRCTVLLWVRDSEGTISFTDGRQVRLGGNAALREAFLSRVHPEDRGRVGFFHDSLETSAEATGVDLTEIEYRFELRPGEQRWIREQRLAVPAPREDGPRVVALGLDVTAQKAGMARIERSEQRFRDIAEIACDWIWEMDEDLRFSYLSNRFFEICPIAPEDVIGKTRLELAHAKAGDDFWLRHIDDLANHRPFYDLEYEVNWADGNTSYLSASGKPIFDGNGDFKGYRGTGTDKTAEVMARKALEKAKVRAELLLAELKERDSELTEQNERFNAALGNMSQGLVMFAADQRLIVCNKRYTELYRLPETLTKPGTPLRKILENRLANGIYAGSDPRAYMDELLDWSKFAGLGSRIHELSDGRTIKIVHHPIAAGGWLTTHEDVTEQRRSEARIAHMAHHDALTDLPNRILLRERIQDAFRHANRGESFAVLCLDLDRFKSVNDTLGHPVGDELLRAVAERLEACTRETDTIARLGGDEFAVVQVFSDSPEHITALARRIGEEIRKPFDLRGHQVMIDTSIGIAVAPQDAGDPDALLRHADLALYRAKSDAGGTYRFYEAEMDARMKARRAMELDLRSALEAGGFELHYQPLVNLETGELSGFEALLRWPRPARGMVPPAEFIPIAEETGLIVPLGEWVMRQACADAATWPQHLRVAVNLSAVQFRSGNLVPMIVNALGNAGLAAERLEIEITEGVLLQDNETTLKTLHLLRDLGVRIAMDDFGTGYSSLSYLRSFPFDKIKIDRSFIAGLDNDDDSLAIVRAVASLSKSLGMTTTAEGVSTQAQLDKVRSEGYTEMQGFLFSPALPAEELARRYFPPAKAAAAAG